jgi:DNA repair exonuclease SbcCD ATPase subunit
LPNLTFQTLSWYNCGSYRGGPHEIKLDHPSQLIYVTGENKVEPELGSNDVGKSTFVNILYWCLTGKVLRTPRAGPAIEPWDSKETSWAVLHCLRDGIPHTISRSRRPNSLVLDNEVAAQDQVAALLGLSEEAIQNTIIAGQFNELFMSLRPEQQSALFAELLNLDIWPKAVDLCSKKIREEEDRLVKYSTNSLELEGSIKEIDKQIGITKEAAAIFESKKEANIKQLKAQLSQKTKEFFNYNSNLKEAKQAVAKLPNITEQEEQLNSLRDQEDSWKESINQHNTTIRINEREVDNVNKLLKQYRETKNTCPACGQVVEQEHINQKISDLSVKHHELVTTIRTSQKARNKHNLQKIADEISKLEESIRGIRQQKEQCNEYYNTCLLQANQKKTEVDQLHKDIDNELSSTNPYNGMLVDLNNNRDVTQRNLTIWNDRIAKSNVNLEHLKLWLDGFKRIRLDLIDETLDELEITSNKHAVRLGLDNWEIGFHTERETKKGDIQHKFTTNIFPPNLDYPIPFDTLGGGVSTRLQLATVFGLSEVLLARAGITTNIEILDEPTKALSDEGVENLLECLKERATETGRAIYLIDHHQLDRGIFDEVLWIEKTEEGSKIAKP